MSETVRRLSIGVTLALIAATAWAQTEEQRDWCSSPHAYADQRIAGCTARIQSGHEAAAILAEDYNSRGAAYVAQGLRDKAIADYTQAIALKSGYVEAYYNRGNAYDGKGRYDQAIADFNQAIALDPDYARAYSNRGAVYEGRGQREKAIADYRAALAADPAMTTARQALVRLGARL